MLVRRARGRGGLAKGRHGNMEPLVSIAELTDGESEESDWLSWLVS